MKECSGLSQVDVLLAHWKMGLASVGPKACRVRSQDAHAIDTGGVECYTPNRAISPSREKILFFGGKQILLKKKCVKYGYT